MDGRDIGTVVLPNAQVKIFLTASPEIRAKRRFDELRAKGKDVAFEDVLNDLNQRDYNDSHRETAPLKQADDAVLLDTSGLDFDQSVEKVCGLIKGRL
jgi:cytidylate kinase